MPVVGRSAGALISAVFAVGSSCRSHRTIAPTPVAPSAVAELRVKPTVAWSQMPVASARVPREQLAGIVVDAESGAPLAMVQVSPPNKLAPSMSDSAGRFRIVAPNVGDTVRFTR